MGFKIAIDGPAGAGKSTIAKQVARRENLIYIDTGAMYRAMSLLMLQNGIPLNDAEKIGQECSRAQIDISYENGEQAVFLNGENVDAFLREERVGNAASAVSAVPRVRERLVQLQRELAESADVVMDGRDIGTVVLPDADLKIFLTASSRVRAERRYRELQEKGIEADLKTIQRDIEERDHRDMTRETSPLRQAEDAVVIDSSMMTVDEVIQNILDLIQSRRK
ncbi:MAG: (d)CMP kinase [Lachnospiraceae bacterium]|jgi:cytidylate kinase|nr:(d)CMP kinase [Lachnospiraceae bacterium]MBF1007746.1 (d)CMP kinase [Lachnospiraceae bacterium]MBF1018933.1 (d)CMP kinase [Lachnospiraceae bacterium]MBF1027618.1 (d)CMP kinase [Lachnospiraceae bacterium]